MRFPDDRGLGESVKKPDSYPLLLSDFFTHNVNHGSSYARFLINYQDQQYQYITTVYRLQGLILCGFLEVPTWGYDVLN